MPERSPDRASIRTPGTGGSPSQLITDFGHTRDLVATSNACSKKLKTRPHLLRNRMCLLETGPAYHCLLNAQSLLDVAKAIVAARGDVQNLTSAQTRGLHSRAGIPDLNIASSADLSQAQLLQLDAENGSRSPRGPFWQLSLRAPADTVYQAVEDPESAPPPPPHSGKFSSHERRSASPSDLTFRLCDSMLRRTRKFASAQQLQHLPTISALALGGTTQSHRTESLFPTCVCSQRSEPDAAPLYRIPHRRPWRRRCGCAQKAAEKEAQDLSDTISRDVRIAL